MRDRGEAADRRRVCIVQTQLPHYRVPLFERLRDTLQARGVDLGLIHGQGDPDKLGRADGGTIPWATVVDNRRPLGGLSPVLWQPLGRHLQGCELVIVTQENRLLQNYWLFARRKFFRQRVAFWGHGRNFQAGSKWRERFRDWQVHWPDWWFAYTAATHDVLVRSRYPAGRITVLDNASDTVALRESLATIAKSESEACRRSLGFNEGPVGVFCSSLHQGKRIDFLLAAAGEIRRRVPNFHLLIVGEGPERGRVEAAREKHAWIHWVGPKFGREKAVYLSAADLFLMPYFVGLSILDAFCAGLPLAAVKPPDGQHSPEIAYLEHDQNGVLTAPSIAGYAAAVESLLLDPSRRGRLGENARAASRRYTIENMTARFADGIVRALDGNPGLA